MDDADLRSRARAAFQRVMHGEPAPPAIDTTRLMPGDTVILRPKRHISLKHELFDRLAAIAKERDIQFIVLSPDDFEAHVLRATGAPE